MEAAGIFPDDEFGSAKVLEAQFLDEINKRVSNSDFFLDVRIIRVSNVSPGYQKLIAALKKRIAGYDPDQVAEDMQTRLDEGKDSRPVIYQFQQKGWNVEFRIMPKKAEKRGNSNHRIIGMTGYDATISDLASKISETIGRKSKRYGNLEIPYVLALNIVDWRLTPDDILDALFGQEQYSYEGVALPRKRNGSWLGPEGFQKTRMSGLLVFRRLNASNMHSVEPVLWHHPRAQHALEPRQWRIRQHIFDDNAGFGHHESVPDVSISELLEIDSELMPR